MRTIVDCFEQEKLEESYQNKKTATKKLIMIIASCCLTSLLSFGGYHIYCLLTKPWWKFW